MKFLLLLGLVIGSQAQAPERRFPDNFLFGTATAAYQIEGGWNADDKGESIWDHMTHTKPHTIKDGSNGDIAADSYNNYKRDVEMMRELNLNVYGFSLSWSRILPNGLANTVSNAGVQFYNNYIDEMLTYHIEPVVTIYHLDLPQRLQDFGGFMNPMFPEWFEDYARVVFEKFGDRVNRWITFNEPREICLEGYGSNKKAPILNATDIGTYHCAKNLLLGHARAYYAYVNEYKDSRSSICGITIGVNWFGPLTQSEDDAYAAEIRRQAEWGIYADPIFSEDGGFPKELAEIVAEKSSKQGYPRSRMPEFTEQEKDFIRGTSDFFGVSHYTSNLVSVQQHKTRYLVYSLVDDVGFYNYVPPDWPKSASQWLRQAPNSIFNSLTHLYKKYDGPIFYITENGWSSTADILDDDRIRYYRAALNSVLDTIAYGVDLRGYMAKSLMDNFEGLPGYTERFGLYRVNFSDPHRTRTARKSAFVFKEIIKTRVIDPDYEPEHLNMSIEEGI